ncbi:A24 family peptidase [Kineococcus sp. TBRC 1896]|uniref:Prepilin leader peptidase/N-methyltransferase n=1 Tax=Kineococcus mangrovi TaxID=1660183 RepID=A0ABV4I5R9_9ACTN
MILLVTLSALLGLAVGSFLNVVVHRVPAGRSVVRPSSRCPGCDRGILRRDNVPVLSWLVLRGRCRHCGTGISVRYPVVELLTGLLFAAVAWQVGLSWALPAYLYLTAIAVALSAIDLDVHRLPDAIVLPSYLVTSVLLLVASLGTGDWYALVRALVGGVALLAVYFALFVVRPGGMGFGDVKLAGVLGLYLGWLGWSELLVGAFLAFLVGGVVSIGLVAFGRAGRRSRIPFGPFMLLGAVTAVFAGAALGQWYVGLFGLTAA